MILFICFREAVHDLKKQKDTSQLCEAKEDILDNLEIPRDLSKIKKGLK